MISKQPPVRSFVAAGKKTTVICPACSYAARIRVKKTSGHKHIFKVKCKCKKIFDLQLEFRHQHRKETDLRGTYDLKSATTGNKNIHIINLSMRGVGFLVVGLHDLKAGQQGTINFTLDNRKKTILKKKVIIRSVNGKRVGGEFIDDTAFDTDLGFYVRS